MHIFRKMSLSWQIAAPQIATFPQPHHGFVTSVSKTHGLPKSVNQQGKRPTTKFSQSLPKFLEDIFKTKTLDDQVDKDSVFEAI